MDDEGVLTGPMRDLGITQDDVDMAGSILGTFEAEKLIYGVGCVLMILLLTRFRKNLLLVFTGACAICETAEYITSWMLEVIFHKRWWDYSGSFLNLEGRVCLEALIAFGMAGIFIVYWGVPFINKGVRKIPENVLRVICVLLLLAFLIDTIISLFQPNCGAGITL